MIAVGIAILIGIETGSFDQRGKFAGRDRAVGSEQDDDLLKIGPAIGWHDQDIGGKHDHIDVFGGNVLPLHGDFEGDCLDPPGAKIGWRFHVRTVVADVAFTPLDTEGTAEHPRDGIIPDISREIVDRTYQRRAERPS